MKCYKPVVDKNTTNPIFISEYCTLLLLIWSSLKIVTNNLDKDVKHSYKFFNLKTLGEDEFGGTHL
jgi:hypothetical protein